MPYTGRPRRSSGPLPMIIVGVVFAAIGVYLAASMPLSGSLGLIFVVFGVAWLLAGIGWFVMRSRSPRMARFGGGWVDDPRLRAAGFGPGSPDAATGAVTWLPGRATIIAAHDVAPSPDGRRLFQLDLQVQAAGRATYSLRHVEAVPAFAVPRLVPGTSLPIQAAANDPNQLLIDWTGQ